jgi:lysophospholipase
MSARYIWLRRLRLVALAALGLAATAGLCIWLAARAVGGGDRDPFLDSRPPPGLAARFYPPPNWAGGLVRAGAGPLQRYGVSAPEAVPRAQVLILPDYGETAETWFETAADLNRAGVTVWVLEGVGQGGSQRLTGRRDLGEVKSFDADVASVSTMIQTVIRPQGDAPLGLLGHGVGAWIALRAVEDGAPASALILSQPLCEAAPAPSWLQGLGMGTLRAGGRGWRRDGPDAFAAGRTHDPWRGAVTHAWQLVNPDLRMGDPSLDWRSAFATLEAAARRGAGSLHAPTLVVSSGPAPCVSPPKARLRQIAGAGPSLELEADPQRAQWLALVEDALGQRGAPLAGHAP